MYPWFPLNLNRKWVSVGWRSQRKCSCRSNMLCVLLMLGFLSARYVSHIPNCSLTINSAKVSQIQAVNNSLPYCTSHECSSYFSGFCGLNWGAWNNFFILASFQGQIGYWSRSLCLLGERLACQNWSLPRWLTICQRWLILWKLCPALC